MKKLLFVALVGTFVACGEATEANEATETAVEAPTMDTTVTDTAILVVDSAAAAMIDSAK